MKRVKIKSWPELKETGKDSGRNFIFAPVGHRHIFPYALELALPKDRVIEIHNDGSWVKGDVLFKIGEWMIDKPDAIEEQAQAHGEGRLKSKYFSPNELNKAI